MALQRVVGRALDRPRRPVCGATLEELSCLIGEAVAEGLRDAFGPGGAASGDGSVP